MKKLYFIFIFFIIISCRETKKYVVDEKTNTVTILLSNSIDTLSKLISIERFRPIKAKFRYFSPTVSNFNERIPVPAPTDYCLQIVMDFDNKLIDSIKSNSLVFRENTNISDWRFAWLTDKEDLFYFDNLINMEIKPIPSYKDSIFTKNGTFIILDNKIYLWKCDE